MRLNCDLGEGFGQWQSGADELAMPHIDMANIACGFHASDPLTMTRTIELAIRHNVTIGAHPGYPDLVGFGRRTIVMEHQELVSCIIYQVGALQALANAQQTQVEYIKPHGALYNDMMADLGVFESVVEACKCLQLPLMLLAGNAFDEYLPLLRSAGVMFYTEGFCDRRYSASGELLSRRHPSGVISDPQEVLEQAAQLANGFVITYEGSKLDLVVDSLCVHGDNDVAVKHIAEIRQMVNKSVI